MIHNITLKKHIHTPPQMQDARAESIESLLRRKRNRTTMWVFVKKSANYNIEGTKVKSMVLLKMLANEMTNQFQYAWCTYGRPSYGQSE